MLCHLPHTYYIYFCSDSSEKQAKLEEDNI